MRVVNRARALLGAHDKLRTALALEAAGLPHPRVAHVRRGGAPPPLTPPLVLKPRFGSWGKDVFRCLTEQDVSHVLEQISHERWFHRHGALAQELAPSPGRDLRVIVAAGSVVGAVERVAAPGEWRTNTSLGGSKHSCVPSADAERLAVAAAAAIGADLVGVDLLPVAGGFLVLELNGAIDFDEEYSRPGRDVYSDAAEALGLIGVEPRLPAASRRSAAPVRA